MITGNRLWVWLTCFVVVYSFGGILLLIVLPLIMGGFLMVFYLSYYEIYYGSHMRKETIPICSGLVQDGAKVVRRRKRGDQRLTGAKLVDEQLQKLVTFCVRDYVESWYYEHISNDPHFIELVRDSASSVLINFSSRSKNVDWLTFFTQRALDDLVSHLRIFRKALKTCHEEHESAKVRDILEDIFFSEEKKTENQPHLQGICCSSEKEKAYLQSIAEMLLYLLLPEDDFQNKSLRFILREVLAENVLMPLVNLLSDPDYFNSTIVMLCRDSSLNPESFIAALHTCGMSVELSTIAGCVLHEIEKTKQRGSSGEHLEQLSSLNYVNKLCQEHCGSITSHNPDVEQEAGNTPLPVVSLRSILTNNNALSYFIDFLSGDPVKQSHVSFWLEAETFHQIMTQLVDKLTDSNEDIGGTLEKYASNARCIFLSHFSEEASSRLVLSEETYEQTIDALEVVPLEPDCLSNAQLEIFHVLEGKSYYEAFLNSKSYRKCLRDLGILSEASQATTDHSISSSASEPVKTKPFKLKATVPSHVEKTEGRKAYTCYQIVVTCLHSMGPEEHFTVERRYSDFHNFHLSLKAKVKPLPANLTLPIPWSLNKHDPALKESRRKGLDTYLQVLLADDKLIKNPQSFEMIVVFLSESYIRENQYINRKVDSITRPFRDLNQKRLRSSTNSPGLFRKILHLPATTDVEGQSTLLSAGLDDQEEENIPLQVMLRLMDEVFELKMKSQGLRRHVTRMLRQFVQATFGSSINRRIIDYVDTLTSPQQLAQQISGLCDSLWPDGCPAPPAPERSETTKHITRVIARAKLLGSMPDDLRRFIGTKNTQEGTSQVLELFQYPRLNKRIVYILFEGLLEAIFSQNKVSDAMKKLH